MRSEYTGCWMFSDVFGIHLGSRKLPKIHLCASRAFKQFSDRGGIRFVYLAVQADNSSCCLDSMPNGKWNCSSVPYQDTWLKIMKPPQKRHASKSRNIKLTLDRNDVVKFMIQHLISQISANFWRCRSAQNAPRSSSAEPTCAVHDQ